MIWIILLFFRGGFWDSRVLTTAPITTLTQKIVAVIPARDEALSVGITITGLLNQTYPGALHIVLVDDHSSDETAMVARDTARALDASEKLTVLAGDPLPPGWTGKLWAVSQGLDYARTLSPDFILLTDADILHDSENLEALVSRAELEQRDLVSQMVLLRCRSFPERALIPAFVFFFFMLYPPRWVADPQQALAGAAGGCMLIRPEALDRIGGISSIRDRLIDDCALAAAVKSKGGRIRLDVTQCAHSLRDYSKSSEIWAMIARSAFTQLGYSTWLLLATFIGLALSYMAPPLLVLFGHNAARVLGLLAWLAMAYAYRPTLALYKLPWPWAFALPAISIFYAAATLGSAINYWRGKGGHWKGRTQAPLSSTR